MIAVAYLAAIVAANLIAAALGPAASIATAFLLIGAALTLRDRLHDQYGPRATLVLVLVGAALSAFLGAERVALASAVAFLIAESADTAGYHLARRRPWLVKANASNVVGAALDSLIFPVIAFGAWLWPIAAGQFLAKTLGGAVWAFLLQRRRLVGAAALLALLARSERSEAQALQPPKPPRFILNVQAGTAHYPWREFRPVPQVGVTAHLFLPARFQLNLVTTRDLERGTRTVYFATVGYRLWSK